MKRTLQCASAHADSAWQDGPDAPPVEIDFTPPWPRISMCSALEKRLGVTFPTDLSTEEARQFFVDLVRARSHRMSASIFR